jgi:hypothetical protein
MANLNTFFQLSNLPGPIAVAETAVASINAIGGTTTPGASTTRALAGVRQDASGGFFDGHPFLVKGVAKAIGTGVGNFTFNLYWNIGANTNLTTFTNDVLLIGSGAIAVASKPAVAVLEAMVIWDSSLQQVMGIKTRSYNNLITTPAVPVVTPALTAANPLVAASATGVSNVSQLQFFATITCSANISSTTLIELSLEQY